MGDFAAYAEDLENGSEWLEHHGILGMKWFKKNGPPYPLGSGDHSSAEKSAAKAAGVSVGSDSGKGSIENVKKKKPKPKKELTPEEKREAALDASRKGDKKKITKNMDQLTTDELRDAKARAELRDSLTKEDPNNKKMTKADREKDAAIKSGDKATIQAYASKMTYNELTEAINKMNLMAQLNHVDPPPTAMDRIKKAADAAGKFKDAAEKGIGAYNAVAKIYNATHKDSQWPLIGEKPKEEKKDGDKEKAKEAVKEVGKEIKKSLEETYADKLKEEKLKYKTEKEFEKWKNKQEAKAAKKDKGKDDEDEEKSTANDEIENDPWWDTVTRNGFDREEGSRPISDDLTPDEEEYLNMFKR